jgi:hypothetical protein
VGGDEAYSQELKRWIDRLEDGMMTARELIDQLLPVWEEKTVFKKEDSMEWIKPNISRKPFLFEGDEIQALEDMELLEPWYLVDVNEHDLVMKRWILSETEGWRWDWKRRRMGKEEKKGRDRKKEGEEVQERETGPVLTLGLRATSEWNEKGKKAAGETEMAVLQMWHRTGEAEWNGKRGTRLS